MESKSWTVIFDGELDSGQTPQDVKNNLAQLFKVNTAKIEPLFASPSVIIKKNLTYATALKYQQAIAKTGAICRIEALKDQPLEMRLDPGETSAEIDQHRMTCPACGFKQDDARECIRCGIVISKYLEKMSGTTPAASHTYSSSSHRRSTGRSFFVGWLVVVPVLLLIAMAVFIWPEKSTVSYGPGVLAPNTPVQHRIREPQKFDYKNFQITPLATFEVEARVLSVKRYRSGREAKLSPIDLALGWGRMSDDNVLKDIDIRQSNRFAHWRVEQFPIPRREIEESCANMHIIPASDDITQQLKDIRKGHVVRFSGYLVRVDARDKWHWQSSLTRKDTGIGACELVWVEEMDII
ncbi:MAG: hypothetical protein PVF56_20425 [Desulfobacterales bacterium]|jgi:hypothetical protein